jgi:hypothetical protein
MKDNTDNILTIIGGLILVVILLGLPLQLLWNWLMPSIFNLPHISFWQAMGLNLMAVIFLKPITLKKD